MPVANAFAADEIAVRRLTHIDCNVGWYRTLQIQKVLQARSKELDVEELSEFQ